MPNDLCDLSHDHTRANPIVASKRAQLGPQLLHLCPVCIRWPVPRAAAHRFSLVTSEFVRQEGKFFEQVNVRQMPWTVNLLVHVNKNIWDKDRDGEDGLGMINPAIQFSLAYRTKDHLYETGMSEREQCIKVVFGESVHFSSSITAWATQMVLHQDIKQALFYPSNWASLSSAPDVVTIGSSVAKSKRYLFEVIDSCICVQACGKKKDDEPHWVEVANFQVVEVLSSYKFFEDPSQPTYQKLLLRHELDKYEEGVVYFECDDLNERHKMRHRAKKARYMEIEVMFSLQKITQNSALISFFKQQNPCLSWGGTFDHFTNYMSTLETPLPHDVISYFGKQESNGVFMAGNCAFRNGRFLTHDEVNMTVIPQYFSQSLMPLHPREYPRHVLIPFPHVRYILCSQVMNDIMPRFFANNLLPAHAVFAMGVMGQLRPSGSRPLNIISR